MPDDVEKHLAFRPMKDFDEISDALLPDVERVLTRGASDDVLAVATEAALFPQGFVDEILQFLDGFRLAVLAARQHLFRLEYPNDAVR